MGYTCFFSPYTVALLLYHGRYQASHGLYPVYEKGVAARTGLADRMKPVFHLNKRICENWKAFELQEPMWTSREGNFVTVKVLQRRCPPFVTFIRSFHVVRYGIRQPLVCIPRALWSLSLPTRSRPRPPSVSSGVGFGLEAGVDESWYQAAELMSFSHFVSAWGPTGPKSRVSSDTPSSVSVSWACRQSNRGRCLKCKWRPLEVGGWS